MSRAKDAGRVPDLLLERHRLGEMPETERARLDRMIEQDADLRARLEQLEGSDAEIQRRYPPAWLAERVRQQLKERGRSPERRRSGWRPRWPVPAALAVAAAVLVVLAPRVAGPPFIGPGSAPEDVVDSTDRLKGSQPSLSLYRKTAGGSEALADGSLARAGDVIRIGYRAAGRAYGVIVSLDGRGTVTLHLPTSGGIAARLRREGIVLLDHAYELDDAPRWERFVLVTSDAPFEVGPVRDAARRAAVAAASTPGAPPLDLPAALEQFTFSLQKGARP
jgi:hypothetical protein